MSEATEERAVGVAGAPGEIFAADNSVEHDAVSVASAVTAATDTPAEEKLSAEERERLENNALADAFDLVRALSAQSLLAEPSDWEEAGLVPAHLEPAEFEMMVYEYVEAYLAEHRQERENEKAAARAKACSHRSATSAVGISPFMRMRAEAAEREVAGVVGNAPASASAEKPVEESVETLVAIDTEATTETAANEAASGAASEGSNVAEPATSADNSPFPGLTIPEGFKLEEIEGEWTLVPDESAEAVPRVINCKGIEALVGKHSYYLYDSNAMTDAYAHWAFLAAEDDPLMTFVDCVREESRTYPRPLAASSLGNPPFYMTAAEVERTWSAVAASGDYLDICRAVASNGDVYYYSTLHLSSVHAEALAEYDAVERPLNV